MSAPARASLSPASGRPSRSSATRSRVRSISVTTWRVRLTSASASAPPEAATRAGTDLAGVRLLLVTHQHSDHLSPAALMHRGWVTDAPLTVAGPPDAIAAARAWLPDDAHVTRKCSEGCQSDQTEQPSVHTR